MSVAPIRMVDPNTYEIRAENKCDQPLNTVVILVKYLNSRGERIGVGSGFVANFVAPHERFRREQPIVGTNGQMEPYVLKHIRYVAVRAIREDAADAQR